MRKVLVITTKIKNANKTINHNFQKMYKTQSRCTGYFFLYTNKNIGKRKKNNTTELSIKQNS